jgi:[protein-PII] uridylyltransferase
MTARFRHDPANRALFMQILRQPQGITHALRLLNQTSVLGRYLWVFRRIVGRMQHDLFHVYTVDQHILMVVRNMRRFFIPEHAHEYPFCSQLASQWDEPWLLYVAALFHDVAKGRGGDHSVLGAAEARRFCRDHGISREHCELIEFLVLQHLTMSRVSQTEDLSDVEVIASFARLVGTPQRLSGLYLLSVADIRGTSPKVWNAWKAKLLEDLYRLTLRALGGAKPNLDAEIETRQHEARALLAQLGAPPGSEQALWHTLDVSYFARHDAADIAWHARALWRHVHTQVPIVRARASSVGDGLQVLVYTPDRPDLFARICGYFDSAGFSIQDAKIHTTRAGYALDTFQVLSAHIDAEGCGLQRADPAGAGAGGAGAGLERPAARTVARPCLAARALVPGDAARRAAARRARAALAAQRQHQRPLRPALRHRPRAGAPPHQPAPGQDQHPGRARRGHLPGRRRRAAACAHAVAGRNRAARCGGTGLSRTEPSQAEPRRAETRRR